MSKDKKKMLIVGGVVAAGVLYTLFGSSANAADAPGQGFVQSGTEGSNGQNTFTKLLGSALASNPVDQSVVDTIPGDNNALATTDPVVMSPGPAGDSPATPTRPLRAPSPNRGPRKFAIRR